MAVTVEDGPRLESLAEKTIQQSAVPEHLTYCPTMDLIALATTEDRVYVYRLNGQRVLGIGNKSVGVKVRKLGWKANGLPHGVSTQTAIMRRRMLTGLK
jgi:anaphase-promoting complex subunit 4